jgi:hypothetical protein
VPLPVLYGAVGHLGARSADGQGAVTIARFTTMTYTGILVAPAVIGWAAQAVGLVWTFMALVPLLVFSRSRPVPPNAPRRCQ